MLHPGRGEGRKYPRHRCARHPETSGLWAPNDCSRRHQRADGRASSPRPRRSAAACWGRCLLWVTVVKAHLLATGHGKAVRTAAVPARADLGCTGGAAPLLRPGPPRPPERTHASRGLVVSRDGAARREHSWASRPKTHSPLNKTFGDGGGSHRRSRAACTAALKDVATQTPLTPAPVRVRSSQGKAQLPHAL